MGYALGKYEESTLSFYNSFAYYKNVSKVVAIAPCPITKASTTLTDNNLMNNCDKVNWHVFAGVTDDICTLDSVKTFLLPGLQKNGKLLTYQEFAGVGHRLKEFESHLLPYLPAQF